MGAANLQRTSGFSQEPILSITQPDGCDADGALLNHNTSGA
eukprot:COSAG01_NODE_5841_length_4002_cov_3.100179_5_plen_41_part_00